MNDLYKLPYSNKINLIRHNKHLDIFIDDSDELIRAAVAQQGYKLDILINDKSHHVRYAVAFEGYGLDILINDPNVLVRNIVITQLKQNPKYKKILLLNNL